MFFCARLLYALVVLFRLFVTGLTPRIAKVAPACAVMISSFEAIKEFFHIRNRLDYAIR